LKVAIHVIRTAESGGMFEGWLAGIYCFNRPGNAISHKLTEPGYFATLSAGLYVKIIIPGRRNSALSASLSVT